MTKKVLNGKEDKKGSLLENEGVKEMSVPDSAGIELDIETQVEKEEEEEEEEEEEKKQSDVSSSTPTKTQSTVQEFTIEEDEDEDEDEDGEVEEDDHKDDNLDSNKTAETQEEDYYFEANQSVSEMHNNSSVQHTPADKNHSSLHQSTLSNGVSIGLSKNIKLLDQSSDSENSSEKESTGKTKETAENEYSVIVEDQDGNVVEYNEPSASPEPQDTHERAEQKTQEGDGESFQERTGQNAQEQEASKEMARYNDTNKYPLYHEEIIGDINQYKIYKKTSRIEITAYLNTKIHEFCTEHEMQLITGNAQFPDDELAAALNYMRKIGPFKGAELIINNEGNIKGQDNDGSNSFENEPIAESVDISTFLSLKWSCIYYDIINYLYYTKGKTLLNFTLQRMKGKWTTIQKRMFNKIKHYYPNEEPRGYEINPKCFEVLENSSAKNLVKEVAILKYQCSESLNIYKIYGDNQTELAIKLKELAHEYAPENLHRHQLASASKRRSSKDSSLKPDKLVVSQRSEGALDTDESVSQEEEEEEEGEIEEEESQEEQVEEFTGKGTAEDEGKEEEQKEADKNHAQTNLKMKRKLATLENDSLDDNNPVQSAKQPKILTISPTTLSETNHEFDSSNSFELVAKSSKVASQKKQTSNKTLNKRVSPEKIGPDFASELPNTALFAKSLQTMTVQELDEHNELMVKKNELLANTVNHYTLLLKLKQLQSELMDDE
ncbi:hypothetical protein ACO0QE_003047 [Hanseniaspora vineae]